MALSTEANVKVKAKSSKGVSAANGAIQLLHKGFWMGMNQENQTQDLQIVQFGNLTVDAVVADAACKIYAIYLKKSATATDAFYKVFDDATDDSTAADAVVALPLLGASEEVFVGSPKGLASCAAGAVHGSYTAFLGYNNSTPSTSGDGPATGFIIIGAA